MIDTIPMADAAEKNSDVKRGDTLLEIRNLETQFVTSEGVARAVDGVSLHVNRGETLGLVGESGCGKSVTSLSVLRLVPSPPGVIAGGEIIFKGRDLLQLSESEMRDIRGDEISLIFQEPMTALNPVFTVGDQIAEVYRIHRGLSRAEAMQRAIEMMDRVRIPSPEQRAYDYPHQLSGGMRQRVMIAMALACDPDLLIADEPTTALDVTVQAQILALMEDIKQRTGAAVILITHDLGVIAEVADRVAVMYAGRVIEEGTVYDIFENPLHPYTQGLLESIPQLDGPATGNLHTIEGAVPNPMDFPSGCRFHPRCDRCFEPCDKEEPHILEVTPGHCVSCFLHDSKKKTPT